jgi:hypothetical protein
MSYLGPEAGYIIITFTSVPFGAFLLSTKTKLLVFISSFSTRPGKRWPHRLLPALSPYEPMAHQYSQIPSYKAPKAILSPEFHPWPYIFTLQTTQASSSIYDFNPQKRKEKAGKNLHISCDFLLS